VQKSLDAFVPQTRRRGRPSNRNAAIAAWLIARQREIDQKALEAIRAGKAKTQEEIAELRRPASLIEAIRAIMPGACKQTMEQARKRFDGFAFCDDKASELAKKQARKRGWGKGRFYKID